MDEVHLHHALRYVSLDPVRARLVSKAQDWQWASVRCHLVPVYQILLVNSILSEVGSLDYLRPN